MDGFFRAKDHNRILGDKGSTLVTVIVAIAFVTILTSIILGTTAVNVRMKGIDKRSKDDFYYAEKALNDIYTGVGQDLAKIAADKYEEAFKKVGDVELSGEDFNHAETAEKKFRSDFLQAAYSHFNAAPDDVKAALQAYITSSARSERVDKVVSVTYQDKEGNDTSVLDDAVRVAIRGVQVSATDMTGFHAVINTDIIVDIPTVDFLGTSADVSDYGLIANKGLYIEGDSTINGNVFAGVHSSPISGVDADYSESYDANSRNGVYGGINISDGKAVFTGNYIVSKGDITLSGSAPEIEVNSPAVGSDANLANLWFTSMRTLSKVSTGTTPKINIHANTFALNDLTLNADSSDVTISGNYYGYNDATLSESLLGEIAGRDDSKNSAIIINGSKVSLNMKQIENFVLMGKAYIDFTTDAQTQAGSMDADKQIVATAEGVALKTNQQLYLVPNDFLDEPNPMLDSIGSSFTLSIPHDDYKNWFGYKYLKTDQTAVSDADKDKPSHKMYDVIVQQVPGDPSSITTVHYDYLVFDDQKTWKPVFTGSEITGYEPNTTNPSDPDDLTSYLDLGTNGSVSSKAAFFFEIMNSEKTYDPVTESSEVQPSAYRLFQRIKLSMENSLYFDLKQCVVGNTASIDDAHYYAKNAVINYERPAASPTTIQTNVFKNTEGMGRYAGYTDHLFHRYIFLCTQLDGKEKILLESSPDVPSGPDMSEWVVDTTAPMSHYISMTNLSNVNSGGGGTLGQMNISASTTAAATAGLKPGAYGVVIATKPAGGTLSIDDSSIVKVGSNTFKGIAIVDGDIVVPDGYNVDGLLMATGTITLKGNNRITYDKGLIQSRIEKETNIVKNEPGSPTWAEATKDYYLINYLTKMNGTDLLYEVTPGTKVKRDRMEADYNEFVHYENWQKGEE